MTFISSSFAGSLAVLLCVSCAAAAEPLTGADLRKAVSDAAAEAGHAADAQVNPDKVFYPCAGEVRITPLFDNWQTVRFTCSAPIKWEIVLRTLVTAELSKDLSGEGQDRDLMAVTLVRPLRGGERLSRDDVALQPVSRRSAFGTFRRIEDVVGRRLVQSIQTGGILRLRHLAQAWVVEEGAAVIMELTRGTVILAGPAVALESGQIGDVIRVRNPSSDTILRARVVDEKKVTVLAKIR